MMHLNHGDEHTAFHFLKWQELYYKEKPFQIYIDIPKDAPDQRSHNLLFEQGQETTVRNVRGRENEYTLDKNGFKYIKSASKLPSSHFYNRQAIEDIYLPECEDMIRNHVDHVDKLCIFDWRVGIRRKIDKFLLSS